MILLGIPLNFCEMESLCRGCKLLFSGFFEIISFALKLGEFDSWIVRFPGGHLPQKVGWFMRLSDPSSSNPEG